MYEHIVKPSTDAKLTDALIDGVHAHVLIQLRPCVLGTERLGFSLPLLAVDVTHSLAQLWRGQVCERKSHDDDRPRKVVREVQTLR